MSMQETFTITLATGELKHCTGRYSFESGGVLAVTTQTETAYYSPAAWTMVTQVDESKLPTLGALRPINQNN